MQYRSQLIDIAHSPVAYIICMLALFVCSCQTTSAKELFFTNYTTDRGLSHNTTRCVAQDNYGFIWIGTSDGINRFDGQRFKVFDSKNYSKHHLDNTSIYSICVDRDNTIWVGTESGVYLFDDNREIFSRFEEATEYGVVVTGKITQIMENLDGKVWIGTEGQGFFIYDKSQNQLAQNSKHGGIVSVITHGEDGAMFVGSQIGFIAEFDSDGEAMRLIPKDIFDPVHVNSGLSSIYYFNNTLWCGLKSAGISMVDLDKKSGKIESSNIPMNPTFPVKAVMAMSQNELMVGSDNGLYLFDIRSNRVEKVSNTHSPHKGYHNVVNYIFRDQEGGIWIATQNNGVDYLARMLKPIQNMLGASDQMEKMVVNCYSEDRDGNIWLGTDNNGVVFVDSRGNVELRPLKNISLEVASNLRSVTSLLVDGSKLWIGTANSGIYTYDLRNKRIVKNYRYNQRYKNTVNSDEIIALHKSRSGTIYVGTQWGFAYYDTTEDSFRREERGGNDINICDFAETTQGEIWVASRNKGTFRFNPQENIWRQVPFNTSQMAATSSINTTCIFVDSQYRVWVGTESGLFFLNRESQLFDPFDKEQNILPDLMIASIEEDDNGRLWISGNMGIISLDIERRRIASHLTTIDGLQSNHFNIRSSLKRSDGRVYFGGINGLTSFYPSDMQENSFIPSVYITELYLNDKLADVKRDKKDSSPLLEPIHRTKQLKLKYNQNSIGFGFASLSYQAPSQNRYQYKLEGVDQEWQSSNETKVLYNNLASGKYRFVVRGSNNDGVWGMESPSVSITVLPPIYASIVAILAYVLLFFATVWGVVKYVRGRQRKKMSDFTKEQEKISYISKIHFFTNLAHEIRTPLSLIKVPLESIINSGEDFSSKTNNYLRMMDKNAGNLLEMVNQLLDLRKNEDTEYIPDIQPCNVSSLLNDICSRFEPVLEVNHLTLKRSIPERVIYSVDRDAMSKIMTNLLSNALKYADREITLSMEDRGSALDIIVSNDGQGIKEGDEESIFKAFFQSDSNKVGTGIGLPLVKLLVEKHKGTIWSENLEGGGVAFHLNIPKLEVETQSVDAPQREPQETTSTIYQEEAGWEKKGGAQVKSDQTVLIVEDDNDLRQIISELIGSKYSILTASNGKQAIEVLESNSCDIVVSDIMMPEMDGYQLCEFIKSDMVYSHIPVIQLTAKTTAEDRIKGLEYGADAYIDKPFSSGHLMVQIDNLLQNRNRIKEALRSAPLHAEANSTGVSRRDYEFIEKLNAQIESNLLEETFYIEDLAESMFMSRSNFYRKIKSLFGVSPNDYLKRYRLKKAAEILVRKDCLVKEVYEQVGFKTSTYFSACFKEEFGVTPRGYQLKYGERKG